MWRQLKYKCNNPNCKFEVTYIYKTHHCCDIDTDCPECRWHDSVIEIYDEVIDAQEKAP